MSGEGSEEGGAMSAGYPSINGRLYVWQAEHRGHEIERRVVHVVDDEDLHHPPALDITLLCLDCGESRRLDPD